MSPRVCSTRSGPATVLRRSCSTSSVASPNYRTSVRGASSDFMPAKAVPFKALADRVENVASIGPSGTSPSQHGRTNATAKDVCIDMATTPSRGGWTTRLGRPKSHSAGCPYVWAYPRAGRDHGMTPRPEDLAARLRDHHGLLALWRCTPDCLITGIHDEGCSPSRDGLIVLEAAALIEPAC